MITRPTSEYLVRHSINASTVYTTNARDFYCVSDIEWIRVAIAPREDLVDDFVDLCSSKFGADRHGLSRSILHAVDMLILPRIGSRRGEDVLKQRALIGQGRCTDLCTGQMEWVLEVEMNAAVVQRVHQFMLKYRTEFVERMHPFGIENYLTRALIESTANVPITGLAGNVTIEIETASVRFQCVQ